MRGAASSAITRRRLLALAFGAGAATGCAAQGRVLRVAPGVRGLEMGSQLRAAREGDTIAVEPGRYAGDVGIVETPGLRIVGLGDGAAFDADGHHAEGKAILVVRANGVTIENLSFRGARVPDGNGAGIRFERGSLTLDHCRFEDNENGLLTGNERDTELVIRDCEFSAAPHHPGLLHHLLYVGAIGRLHASGSRFHGGFRGHLLKSRAFESDVRYNMLVDGRGGSASYELEFPNGGRCVVVGNVIGQSRSTDNPVVVCMGAEGDAGRPESSLLLSHNTVLSGNVRGAEFVRVWKERLRAGVRIRSVNNLFVGEGTLAPPAGQEGSGDARIDIADLRNPEHGDYRLVARSPLLGKAVPLHDDTRPVAQFMWPVGTRPLAASEVLSPGAMSAGEISAIKPCSAGMHLREPP